MFTSPLVVISSSHNYKTKDARRLNLWYDVWETAERRLIGSHKERAKLKILCQRASHWEAFVPEHKLSQYRTIYRRYHSCANHILDDHNSFEEYDFVDPDLASRIAKDAPRTLSGFVDDHDDLASMLERWFGSTATTSRINHDFDFKLTLAKMLYIGAIKVTHSYRQGMNFIAARILLERRDNVENAFALFAYLVHDLNVQALYGRSLAAYLGSFTLAVRTHAPRVHELFQHLQFEPQFYAVEWFSALFVLTLPRTLSLALFDLMFATIPDAPLRLAVGLLSSVYPALAQLTQFDQTILHFKRILQANIDPLNCLVAALDVFSDGTDTLQLLNRCHTPYGRGRILDERSDGFARVKLDWGGVAMLKLRANRVEPECASAPLSRASRDDLPLPSPKQPARPLLRAASPSPKHDSALVVTALPSVSPSVVRHQPESKSQFDWIFNDLLY